MGAIKRILTWKNWRTIGLLASVLYAGLGVVEYFVDVGPAHTIAYGMVAVFVLGMVICMAQNTGRIKIRASLLLLIIYLGWYLVCCLSMNVTYQGDWVTYNREPFIDLIICFLVIYPLATWLAREERKSLIIKALPHILLLGWTLFMIYVLVMLFQGKSIELPNGGWIVMRDKDSLYMNCNRNLTGAWELIFFFGCFYMLLKVRRMPWKVVYAAATVVHYVTLVLSNSRTSFLSAMIGFALMIGIMMNSRFKDVTTKKRLVLTGTVIVGAALLFYLLRNPTFQIYWKIAFPGEDFSVRDMAAQSGGDVLSGRSRLWQLTFKAAFSSWRQVLFGVTPVSLGNLLEQFGAGAGTYTHNEILEILVASGIVGLAICVAWFVFMLKDMWIMFVKRKERSLDLCVPVMILCFLLANMFEATLLYYPRLTTGYVFFMLCGMLEGKVNGVLLCEENEEPIQKLNVEYMGTGAASAE